MKKKMTLLILTAAILLTAPGCSRFIVGDYYSEAQHTETDAGTPGIAVSEISAYGPLREAVLSMVENCLEYGNISISDKYAMGDPISDMSRACLEVTRQTAVGAFAVDYMTHAYTKTVSGYNMEVYITYKRTPEQLFAVTEYHYLSEAVNAFNNMIELENDYLAIRLDTSILDDAYLEKLLDEIYYSSTSALIIRPDVQAEVFPETGIQRIVEIHVDYGVSKLEAASRREELAVASTRYEGIDGNEAQRAIELCSRIGAETEYINDSESGDKFSSAAYGAICQAKAGSEGIAMAVTRLCSAAGIRCITVHGATGMYEHWWNIITIDGENYHFDASEIASRGAENALLLNDDAQSAFCEWDKTKYPACSGTLDYSEALAAGEQENAPEAQIQA